MELCTELFYAYLVSLLFADLLSLHLVTLLYTNLMFTLFFSHCLFASTIC